MKKNTVLLNLDDYNDLRDFKKEVKEGKVFTTRLSYDYGETTKTYYTESEVVEEMAEGQSLMEAKYYELRREIIEMKADKVKESEPKEITIEDIKKMNFWEFRKWKKSE